MGIGDFWQKVSQCERIVNFSGLREILATDRNPKIAFDTSIFIQANISVVWSNIFSGEFSPDLLNEDHIVNTVKSMIKEMNMKFKKNNMEPVWCLEGKKSENKLVCEKRNSKYSKANDELIYYYLKAKIAAGSSPESAQRISQLSIIEKILNKATFDIDTVKVDFTKEKFSNIYKKLMICLQNTQVRTPSMMKRIYEIFTEPEFESLLIPEISEAEKLCAILTHIGYCEAVFTTDSDSIVMGSKYVFHKKKLSEQEKNSEMYKSHKYDTFYSLYSYYDILSQMKWTPDDLFLWAVLFGNDFNTKVDGNGPVTIQKYLNDPNFDIYAYNILNCDSLKPDICHAELSISENEKKLVKQKLMER